MSDGSTTTRRAIRCATRASGRTSRTGRFFLQTTPQRYDLITGEPPPPKMAGVASLYTREYFELMKDRLNPGGIATYWLPAYLALEDEALAIIRAFCEAFEDCSLWSGFHRDWILVGSRGGIAPVTRAHFSLGYGTWRAPAASCAGSASTARRSSPRSSWPIPKPCASSPPRRRCSSTTIRAASARCFMPSARGTPPGDGRGLGRARLKRAPGPRSCPPARRREPRGLPPPGDDGPGALLELRGPDYSLWSHVAHLIRHTDLVELP